MRFAVAVALAISSAAARAEKVEFSIPEFIGFGSRMGMDVTVISKQGIGTKHAVIRAQLTQENARRYCEDYAQDSSQRCVDEYLGNTHLADSITADCDTGMFTTFYGEQLQFIERNTSSGSLARFIVRNLKDGSTLDGTSASGLSYDMEQFSALCPGRENVVAKISGADDPRTTLPAAQSSSSLGVGWSKRMSEAKDKMTKCMQIRPEPHDGIERQVEKVVHGYVTSCGQDYIAVWRQAGATANQSLTAAMVDAYNALGCRYSNPTQANLQHVPQGDRSITCSVLNRPAALEAKKQNLVAVTARGMTAVPGAIVCPDTDTVSLIYDRYVAHWADAKQGAASHGQWRLLHAEPASAPDPTLYGCALLPPGTPMTLELGNIVPVVTAKLPDGSMVRGVTLAAMISGQ